MINHLSGVLLSHPWGAVHSLELDELRDKEMDIRLRAAHAGNACRRRST
jgi:hypothetical protein